MHAFARRSRTTNREDMAKTATLNLSDLARPMTAVRKGEHVRRELMLAEEAIAEVQLALNLGVREVLHRLV